ncbi:MAG: NADH oxidase [Candidatus Hepatoplasma scabrum]|nr:MAG: NADH oxidase [Candidatus Hepatoplasma sp.]
MKKKIVFLGVNHAGTVAISTLLEKNNRDYEVLAIEKNDNCSFLGCGIALWISNVVKDPNGLFYSSKEKLEKLGAKIYLKHEVSKVDFKNKIVFFKDLNSNRQYQTSYDKLVISIGSKPFVPKFRSSKFEDWSNIITVKTYDNAKWIINYLKREDVKKVSIIGGGYIGVELAEAVKMYGKETTIIDAVPKILQRYYDPEFTELMTKRMAAKGIKFELNQLVEDLKGRDGKVTSIKTNKKEIETDFVIFAIGATPNTELFKNTELKLLGNGAILTNKHQETNIKDVYAIGDCATIYNSITNKADYIALASNAVRTGKSAAYNILGRNDLIEGATGSNAISIYGLNMVSTGLNTEAAKRSGFEIEESYIESEQKPDFMNEPHKVELKVIYDKKSRLILGAQMASTYDISMGIHMFSLAIAKKTKIDELKYLDFFFLPRFNQPFNYINDVALKCPD